MKKFNKIISVVLTLVLMMSIIPVSSFQVSAAKIPVFTLSPSCAAAGVGDVISVDVNVSANSRICGLIIDLVYDTDAYEVVEVTSEYEFNAETMNPSYLNNTVRFVGTATTYIRDEATKLFTVKFRILDNCAEMYMLFKEVYVVAGEKDVDVTLDSNILSRSLVIHEAGNENLISAPTCENTGYKTYNCSCGEFVEEITPATGHKYKNRVCTVCGKTAPDDVVTVTIQDPSRITIRHKDGIILHANVEGDPTGTSLVWTQSNDNFTTETSGNDLEIVSKNNGYTTFTASVYNERGKLLATYSIEMRSKAGFFDKIGGFFRGLFGTTIIYEY
ncbi:MAG: hypothetical protein IJZ16_04995 [Clostridia bacterium]|nr:hypothetical protein [Clostridia bacterium]